MGTPRIDNLDKNTVINGCLEYWQRGTSFTSLPASTYFADRFRYNKVGSQVINVIQSPDVPVINGFQPSYSMEISVSTANAAPASGDYSSVLHIIENRIMRHMIGDTVTVLFSIKSPKTGKHFVSVVTANGGNSIQLSFNVSTANTWQRVAIPFTLPAGYSYLSGSTGLILHFPLMVGSSLRSSSENTWNAGSFVAGPLPPNLLDSTSNVIKLSAIELCAGSFDVSKSFSLAGRDTRDELSLCQQYCYSPLVIGAGSILQPIAVGKADSSTSASIPIILPVRMRANPVMAIVGSVGDFSVASSNGSELACTNITQDATGPNSLRLTATVASGLVAGDGTMLGRRGGANIISTSMYFSAEL